jgi:hypothetical protein
MDPQRDVTAFIGDFREGDPCDGGGLSFRIQRSGPKAFLETGLSEKSGSGGRHQDAQENQSHEGDPMGWSSPASPAEGLPPRQPEEEPTQEGSPEGGSEDSKRGDIGFPGE